MSQFNSPAQDNKDISFYLNRHEHVLETFLNDTSIPAPALKAAIHYALFPGGKRFRPLLVYLGGQLVGVKIECLDIIAAAIELVHCYSLVHDDLPAMDDDDFRRGNPSCHKAFGEATAILAGDAMQMLAMEVLLKYLPQFLDSTRVNTISLILAQASGAGGMVSGQLLDMLPETTAKDQNPENRLRFMHSLKTGQLILACFEMILVAADTSVDPRLAHALRSFAAHLGLVFQMQDDYLDYYSPDKEKGKKRNSDKANQKLTFVALYTQEALFDHIQSYFHEAQLMLAPWHEHTKQLMHLVESIHYRPY